MIKKYDEVKAPAFWRDVRAFHNKLGKLLYKSGKKGAWLTEAMYFVLLVFVDNAETGMIEKGCSHADLELWKDAARRFGASHWRRTIVVEADLEVCRRALQTVDPKKN